MFKEEADKIGEGITKAAFLSFSIILTFCSISILVSLICDIGKQLLINEILTRIILSLVFFGFGFGSLRFWRIKNKVNKEEEDWETLRQISNDYHDNSL